MPCPDSEGWWGVSPQVGAVWPASSSARAHRRGPLPNAPMPRTPPQHAPRRNAPWVMRSASWPGRLSRARCASRRAKSQLTGPERRALSGSAPPASRALPSVASLAAQEQTLERRSLCRPGGPDDEDQAGGLARNARGEPRILGRFGERRMMQFVTTQELGTAEVEESKPCPQVSNPNVPFLLIGS